MQSTSEPQLPFTVKVWRAIFWRSQKLNNMTGLENAIRLIILLLFAAYFVMPLVWLALAPGRVWQDLYDLTKPVLIIGPLSQYVQAWNNIALFGKGLLEQWTVNSVWYTFASVGLSVAVSIPTGYVLATMRFRGRQLVMWLTLITMIIPTSAMVLPLFLEMNALKLVDNPWSVILPRPSPRLGFTYRMSITASPCPKTCWRRARWTAAMSGSSSGTLACRWAGP